MIPAGALRCSGTYVRTSKFTPGQTDRPPVVRISTSKRARGKSGRTDLLAKAVPSSERGKKKQYKSAKFKQKSLA